MLPVNALTYGKTEQKLPQYDSGEAGNALYYFDDLVSYKERWQLQTAWDRTGGCQYIYVVDYSNTRVEKFNLGGVYISQFSTIADGLWSNPSYMAIDASGNFWIVDGYSSRVEEFNSSGSFVTGIGAGYQGAGGSKGSNGTGNGQFTLDWGGIAIDSSGNIWVADYGNNRVQKFNSSGSYLSQFGSAGSGNGQFNNPHALAFDSGCLTVLGAMHRTH